LIAVPVVAGADVSLTALAGTDSAVAIPIPRPWLHATLFLLATGLLIVLDRQRAMADHEARRAGARYRAVADRDRALVEAIDGVSYVHDLSTDRIRWDGDVPALIGCGRDDLGRTRAEWLDRIAPEDRGVVAAARRQGLAEGVLAPIEYRVRRQDGRLAWVRDTAVFTRAGGIERVIGVCRDVTGRKDDETRLRDSDQRFRLVTELGSDLVYEWDLDHDTVHRFGRVTEMLGDAIPEVIEHRTTWEQAIHQEDRERVLAAVQRHLDEGTAYREQYRVITRDGQVRMWTDRGSVRRDASGRPVKWVGVTTDVTEHLALEDRLRQSQKMESVGQLAGGVAHDFNNLLQVIQGYALLAQDEHASATDRAHNLTQVTEAATRAAQLTRQLLAFARRQPMQLVSVDLADLVGQLLKLVRRLIGEHITVEFTSEGETGPVHCDRGQVEQVLVNLCVNARDSMPNGGRLTIHVADITVTEAEARRRPGLRPGRYVGLRVTDTGTGMSEATRRRVFEPFFTTKPEGRGTGLGLAVVYGIVKQHEGYIDVASTEGRGTTVTILMPRRAVAKTATPPPTLAISLPSRSELILLAEDEPNVRLLGETVLRGAGYRVISAPDGQVAIDLFATHADELALVILDVVMPRIGGRDVAQRIAEAKPDLPVLLCSGYPGTNADGSPLSPRWAFVQKPWLPADLLGRVRTLIESRAR
jgi:PAS domain S-box-containing protein